MEVALILRGPPKIWSLHVLKDLGPGFAKLQILNQVDY